MSHQEWIGTLATVTGTTQTTTYSLGTSSTSAKANASMWGYATFGWKGTTSVAGSTYTVGVWGNFNGVSIKIAEVSGLMGNSMLTVPLVNEGLAPFGAWGITQVSCIGVPHPKTLVLTAVSAGIGITFGGVLSAILFRP